LKFFDKADDTALIEKCLERDQKAWSELVGRHTALVYNVARHCGLDPQDAEDVVQDVFSSLFQNLRSVEVLPAWLFRTAKNDAINKFYAKKNHAPLDEKMPAPKIELRRIEQRELIEKALNHLSKTERQVMVLLLRNPDVTDAEIASETRTKVSGVPMLKGRAIQHFESAYKL
jgi:RNA polymerase sigma-70 factor (ECF subfamily)